VAESCTAGALGAALTEPAGASAHFLGGVISYADAAKQRLLGVPAELIAARGAVSEPVARAMASGARERLGSDFALAITGIAGPGGGTEDKPVGTTWIALATPAAVFARRFRLPATRRQNRRLAVNVALDSLRRVLAGSDDRPPWRPDDAWAWDPTD
jgi:nicotinamide-nucleotide amidase